MDPVLVSGDPAHPMRPSVLKLAEQLYRAKIVKAHPDKGGSTEDMRDLNAAIESARRVLA